MLKSSSHYKRALKKIEKFLIPVVCLSLVAGVGITMTSMFLSIKNQDKIMEGTGYFEYIEENKTKYENQYENGEITYNQYEASIQSLRNKSLYLEMIGDKETLGLLKQAENNALFYSLGFGSISILAILVPYFIIEGKLKNLAERAEKVEAMRAETDSIKVNYDPKHSSDDDYNIKML